jgi:hypothetical protein
MKELIEESEPEEYGHEGIEFEEVIYSSTGTDSPGG